MFFSLSYAIGRQLTGKENVVTTDYEHYANISPWIELEKTGKIKQVRFARLNGDEGTLDMENVKELIDAKTKVVTVTAASNVLGTKSRLKEIQKMAEEVDAYFVVDAVHHIAHGPIDVQDLNCDFLVFSGYKLFSSHGSFLYGKRHLLDNLKPYKVAPASTDPPHNWEWGTRDQSMFAAMSGVMNHLAWLASEVKDRYTGSLTQYSGQKRLLKIAMDAIEKNEVHMSKAVLLGFEEFKGLRYIPNTNIYGLTDPNRLDERDPTFAFKVKNTPDEDVVDRLWRDGGIAARAENFYSRVLESYNQKTMIRISLVHYNTLDEVGAFLKNIDKICKSK